MMSLLEIITSVGIGLLIGFFVIWIDLRKWKK